ncbi:MAG: ribonuclease Y [Rhodothermales bacterium]|jgi:ribonuclease Y
MTPAIIGAAVGFAICWVLNSVRGKSASATASVQVKNAEQEAEGIRKSAKQDADNALKESRIEAKDELLKMRDDFEKSTRDRRIELQDLEKRMNEREVNIERKMDLVQGRLDELSQRDQALSESERKVKRRQDELDELLKKETRQLEGMAGMSRDQARVQIMQKLEQQLANERGTLVRRSVEEMKQTCEREAQKILVGAMQRLSSDCAYERTTRTVQLPSDEMKGRIIGREGRNIRVFEAATGVTVLIDDTPQAVVITCFDPVRLEVAHLALERLVEDGRIHPTRVEEVVEKCKAEIDAQIVAAGEDALHSLQIANTPIAVVKVLGRLRFRYSYSQNVLQHSVEVARFMTMMAAELGMDQDRAKRMGLFHDIGKALDHDVEGSHALIGMEFLKRANFVDDEVLNGVGCHHDEIPAETPLAAMVCVADSMSASRPGARSETTEFYVKRLQQLEEIGCSFKGVESCYAVQAGREIRVVVEPDEVNENEAYCMARDIVTRIEEEMQYPGQIKVCVVRETRSVEYAK